MALRKRMSSKLFGVLGVGLGVVFITVGTYQFAVKRELPLPKFLATLAFCAALLIGSALSLRRGSSAGRHGAEVFTMKEAVAVTVLASLVVFAVLDLLIWCKCVSPVLGTFMLLGSLYLSYGVVKLILRVRGQARAALAEAGTAERGSQAPDRE